MARGGLLLRFHVHVYVCLYIRVLWCIYMMVSDLYFFRNIIGSLKLPEFWENQGGGYVGSRGIQFVKALGTKTLYVRALSLKG